VVAWRINVSAVTTTYVTGTVTCIVYRSMIKRRPEDDGFDKDNVGGSGSALLVMVWIGYQAGAAASVFLMKWSQIAAASIPLVLASVVVAAGIWMGHEP